MGMVFFIEQILTKYGQDAVVTRLADAFDFDLIPIMNVDGAQAHLSLSPLPCPLPTSAPPSPLSLLLSSFSPLLLPSPVYPLLPSAKPISSPPLPLSPSTPPPPPLSLRPRATICKLKFALMWYRLAGYLFSWENDQFRTWRKSRSIHPANIAAFAGAAPHNMDYPPTRWP